MYRIIPCLDVYDNKVVKGVKFKDHEIIGDILDLALKYYNDGADELVFYDISASTENRTADYNWIKKISTKIDIPICVAGGIRSVEAAKKLFDSGADKVSINSPALENPKLIEELAATFGSEKVVVGIDSFEDNDEYYVYQYTGKEETTKASGFKTVDWVKEVELRGAGEIVLNCMNQDGVRKGYDIKQLQIISELINIPLIASGGAGQLDDFIKVFKQTSVAGALAASIFHKNILTVKEIKEYLKEQI